MTEKIINITGQEEKTILITQSTNQKIIINLDEHGADFTGVIVIIAKDQENIELEAVLQHNKPETKGHLHIRSLAYDKAKIAVTGMVKIPETSIKSDSYFGHQALILSKNSQTFTTPCLEIETADVSAGHSAGVGHLDEEMLFYLNSRGFQKKTKKS